MADDMSSYQVKRSSSSFREMIVIVSLNVPSSTQILCCHDIQLLSAENIQIHLLACSRCMKVL